MCVCIELSRMDPRSDIFFECLSSPAGGGSPIPEPAPGASNTLAVDSATSTISAAFYDSSLDMDTADWVPGDPLLGLDSDCGLVVHGDLMCGDHDNDDHNQFQETKKLDSDMSVDFGIIKSTETIPSSESNGYPTSNPVLDLVISSESNEHPTSNPVGHLAVSSESNEHPTSNPVGHLAVSSESKGYPTSNPVRDLVPSSESNGYLTSNPVRGLVQGKDYSSFQGFHYGCININSLNRLKSIINGQLGKSQDQRIIIYWLERLMYHWFKIHRSHYFMSEIQGLKLTTDLIKAATEFSGGGKEGISHFLTCVGENLKQARRSSPSMVQSSDENSHPIIDSLVRSIEISSGSDTILELMEYIIASTTPQPDTVYYASSFIQGINHHQSQSQVDYPSSVMLRDGQVNYSFHQSTVETKQVSGIRSFHCGTSSNTFSPTSFHDAPTTGPVATNLVGIRQLHGSSSFFPDRIVNQSQGIDDKHTMAGPEATRLASNQFDESPSLMTKEARINRRNMVMGKRSKCSPSMSLASPSFRPSKCLKRSQNRERISHSMKETKNDNSNKSYTVILRKELGNTDVSNLGRIVLPKKDAEAHLPHLTDREGTQLKIADMTLPHIWNLRYRFWPNNKSRMYILENTGEFVRRHGLQAGDYMVLYRDESMNLVIEGKKVQPEIGISTGDTQITSDILKFQMKRQYG